MSLISKPYTFTVGSTIIAAQHNSNFDTIVNDYNGNITDANLSGSFSLDESKVGNISTYGKVSGSALTQLNTINTSAGYIPVANLNAIPNSALATVGTGAGYLVVCSNINKLPAMDGSQLTEVLTTAKVYTSTWFSVAALSNYTLTHNLGTTLFLIQIYYSASSDGSSPMLVRNWDAENQVTCGYRIDTITTTQMTVKTANTFVNTTVFAGTNTHVTTGYYKVVALALV
jgi:hypothetical protein